MVVYLFDEVMDVERNVYQILVREYYGYKKVIVDEGN